MLNTLLAKQVDGVIFMGHHLTEEIRGEFSRSKTPVVLAGSIDPDQQVGSVNIDYKEAMKDATNKLIKSGNEKVAFISGSLLDPINGVLRLSGYKEALKENGILFNEGLVFESEYSYKAGLGLYERMTHSGATAAVVADDELAVGLLNSLTDNGVSVPSDFEIITSNNSLFTDMARPSVTSISQPLYDIGAVAMRLLTKLMNKEDIEEKSVILPYGLIEKVRQNKK